ncbi:MAG: hypothetical protein BGN96_10495 [Bacteroidales bacterium 45-6]|nr:MAG: hypothetical protein BGN96_10495 [Bacteroidales bacterium 45-6]
MNYQGTYQIRATSEKSISYVSEDEFHATVNATGLVTAGKVGEMNVLVSDGSTTKKFNVKVTPKSALYNEPLTDWTLTKAQVISKLGTPYNQTDSLCVYRQSDPAVSYLMYLFTTAGKIKGVVTTVGTRHTTSLTTILTERYAGTSNDVYFYMNQITYAKATTIIGMFFG